MAESKVGWGEEFLTLKHQYRVYIMPVEFSYLSFVDRLNLQKVPQSQEGLFLKASHSQLFYVNHYIVVYYLSAWYMFIFTFSYCGRDGVKLVSLLIFLNTPSSHLLDILKLVKTSLLKP